jgi:RNA polymerase subunit RPABC4/transcription elongation factor Spt4
MTDTINCPNCGYENDTTDWIECWNGDSDCWDEECPNCEKNFEVTVSIEVIYRTTDI